MALEIKDNGFQKQNRKNELDAWLCFAQSGTVYDYIRYRNAVNAEEITQNVDQDRGTGSQAAEYR